MTNKDAIDELKRIGTVESRRRLKIIEGRVSNKVEELSREKVIHVWDRNTGKYVRPEIDLPTLDISNMAKYVYSNAVRDYVHMKTYCKMKEQDLLDEITDVDISDVVFKKTKG